MTEQTRVSPIPKERSARSVTLDNLVRRKLRVNDPSDPAEIATALKGFYDKERQALEQEAAGLPFVHLRTIHESCAERTATRVELTQARDDVQRDLQALINNASLKDVQAELRGWQHAIGRLVTDGCDAARFALDPLQRDSAMAARRQLGAYARMARYVGALTPNLSLPYRQLGKSLDQVAAMIVVLLGDAIADTGPGGARFLLQAPASELQARRDAIVQALRTLVGSTTEDYGSNAWPRGLVAYREFIGQLEQNGHADLRSLFQERYVTKTLDDLVHWATSGAADDLRALASTSQLALERFRRLTLLASRFVDPEAPPLAAYLAAVQFFLDAFEHGASGARLLFIARPPIVFYGLYGMSGIEEPGARRLLDLVIARQQLAERVDCYLGCGCGNDRVRCQIILDKLLYDVDRAVDLYALGVKSDGRPEQRAAAYGVLIDRFLTDPSLSADEVERIHCEDYNDRRYAVCDTVYATCLESTPEIANLLEKIRALLWWDTPGSLSGPAAFGLGAFQAYDEEQAQTFLVPGFAGSPGFGDLGDAMRVVLTAIRNQTLTPLDALKTLDSPAARDWAHHLAMLRGMHQELCMQLRMEEQWEGLLRTMAPSCLRPNGGGSSMLACTGLLQDAIDSVALEQGCTSYKPGIPPHFETSLAGLTYLRHSEGE